ncbi:MAG: hypothetical protein ABIK12_09575, partial [Pseudomonadota bacterium]
KKGISCCKLYINDPPYIPVKIIFSSTYVCYPQVSLMLEAPLDPYWKIEKWNDLFERKFDDEKKQITGLDAIEKFYFAGEEKSRERMKEGVVFPPKWLKVIEYVEEKSGKSLKIIIRGAWRVYEGRLEAHLVNGSYNFISEDFVGNISSPFVDLLRSQPGPDWELVENLEEFEPRDSLIRSVIVLTRGSIRESLVAKIGDAPIIQGKMIEAPEIKTT